MKKIEAGTTTTGSVFETTVQLRENEFLDGTLISSSGVSGDYADDYYFSVFASGSYSGNSGIVDVAGADGDSGTLTLFEEGPFEFSGNASIIFGAGGSVSIEYDFNLL